ncbi:MAG: hypothetical protein GY801_05005, partial [bacterium]|nr:hypothetical protein [bacterium]
MPDSTSEKPKKQTGAGQQSTIDNRQSEDNQQSEERKMLDFTLMKRLLPYVQDHSILLGLSLFFMLGMNISGVLHPYLIK